MTDAGLGREQALPEIVNLASEVKIEATRRGGEERYADLLSQPGFVASPPRDVGATVHFSRRSERSSDGAFVGGIRRLGVSFF